MHSYDIIMVNKCMNKSVLMVTAHETYFLSDIGVVVRRFMSHNTFHSTITIAVVEFCEITVMFIGYIYRIHISDIVVYIRISRHNRGPFSLQILFFLTVFLGFMPAFKFTIAPAFWYVLKLFFSQFADVFAVNFCSFLNTMIIYILIFFGRNRRDHR